MTTSTTSTERIAVRLIRLSLHADGTLPTTYLLGDATRAALLTDLAFAGALTDTAGAVEVDTTPTGFPPADRLLSAVVEQPDKTVMWWLQRGPDSVHEIVDCLVHDGTWSRSGHVLGHHYRDADPAAVAADLERVRQAAHTGVADPHTAALTTIVDAVGTTRLHGGQQAGPRILNDCGPAHWLMGDIGTYLLQRRADLSAIAAEGGAGLAINFMA